MLERNTPRPPKNLNILFRKFAAHKLDIKEMKAKFKTRKSKQELVPRLEELEKEAKRLQDLKIRYSFADSSEAGFLAERFAQALEDMERKLKALKSLSKESRA